MRKYQKLKKIGTGGMSDVWLVEDVLTKKRYAMKESKKENQRASLYEEALRKEAMILSGLHHPSIPALIEYDPAGFLVMEYIEGKSLEHKLSETISKQVLREWMDEIVDILCYLHQHGVFYLDLKPQNIIEDTKKRLHLIDFGVSVNEHSQRIYAITPRIWCS